MMSIRNEEKVKGMGKCFVIKVLAICNHMILL